MGWGPVPSTQKLLKKTGVSLKDIELIELNEAFAAQYLACERGLDINREITNVNGSGVGLGHPVGCTGARIVISLLGEMKRRGQQPGPGHPVRGRRHGHVHAGGKRVRGRVGGNFFAKKFPPTPPFKKLSGLLLLRKSNPGFEGYAS